MQILLPAAQQIGEVLKRRGETIAVAESSSGGLISAALLSVPGASAYFLGSSVFYTRKSLKELLGLGEPEFARMRGLTEATALVLAHAIRCRLASSWAIAEIGASGPTGSRYGDPPGTSCIAVVGERERTAVIRTGSADRIANMQAFAEAAMTLLSETIVQS